VHIRGAVALLGTKASSEELGGYQRFVLAPADKAAVAHKQ
jgi:hypothetical protein